MELARIGRQADPSGALADYFYGRCLTEAGVELEEAIGLLQRSALAEPGNPLMIHTLALALARSEIHTNRIAAAEIWNKHGLPLDLDLLGQVSLTLEAQTRAWPDSEMRIAECGMRNEDVAAEAKSSDKMSQLTATKSMGFWKRWKLGREIGRLEDTLMKNEPARALEMADSLLRGGLESPELHLVAGLAAEEAGLAARARAHLSRADKMEPTMFLARTWLGRIYWRNGWHELALALWRSIPVEGPYDYGRHYHLALGHDAMGNRGAALTAMKVALDRFYFDTRHFYIKRALWAWENRWAPELAKAAA